jgi:flagellar hook-basal body complex protein FliE
MSAAPIMPIVPSPLAPAIAPELSVPATPVTGASFAQVLMQGIDGVNDKLVEADKLARAFALDDALPAHQVTFALSQAQLSLELMLQVRNRLVEGYQQLMNMQL